MKRRARAWVIAVAVIAVLGGVILVAGFTLRPSEVVLEAVNAEGRSMALTSAPYPAVTRGGKPVLPFGDLRFRGWAWLVSGDRLSLTYNDMLSVTAYEDQFKGSCPPSVDPEAVKAMVGAIYAVKYPYAKQRIDLPFEPVGSFYAADLPGDGIIMVRLEPGKIPAEVHATINGEPIPVHELTPREAVAIQMQGEPVQTYLHDMLEDKVIRNDVQAVLAETDEQRAAALDGACAVIGEMLVAYKARHGAYPASLAGLVTVPEAICSRLPLNPYSVEEQLGLEADAAILPATVTYDPAAPELVRVVQQGVGASGKEAPAAGFEPAT
jgi:hypothetical protein